jgi:hypothetical protein
MKIFFFAVFILLLTGPRGRCQDTIQLKKYFGDLKKIDVVISGISYSFLFDTGGGETMISPSLAKSLKKNIHGRVTGFRMNGEMIAYPVSDSITLTMGRTKIFHRVTGVWDLMSILPKELPALDGVISLNSFENLIITLDLGNNRIIIHNQMSFKKEVSKKTLLQSRFANGLAGNELNIFLALYKKRHRYWFLFDSGNIGNMLFSHQSAYEWGFETDTTNINKDLGTISVILGKKKLNTTAESASIIYDGALNYDILSKSTFVIDFRIKKIWMEQ